MAKILKTSFLDEGKRDALIKEVEKDRQLLNRSVADLDDLGISITGTELLKQVSPDWLRRYLTQSYKNFTAHGFIPPKTKQRVLDEYNETGRMAEAPCKAIQGVLAKRPFDIKRDSKGNYWFDEKQVKQWATEQATRVFTDAERQYYSLLGQLLELLNQVSEFEAGNCLRQFVVSGRTYATPDGHTIHNSLASYFGDRDKNGEPTGKLTITMERYLELIRRENLFQ